MSGNFVKNRFLRSLGLTALQYRAKFQSGVCESKVLINSYPKSGTHLLTALLEENEGLVHSYVHVPTRLVNTNDTHLGFEIDSMKFEKFLGKVKCGHYFTAHLPYSKKLDSLLAYHKVKLVTVLRDPRDILLSLLYYISNLSRHRNNNVLLTQFSSDFERMEALISGVMSNVGSQYIDGLEPQTLKMDMYAGWLESKNGIVVRFEDLVGNGSLAHLRKLQQLKDILAYVGVNADENSVETMLTAIQSKPTPTLRSGKAQAWRSSGSEFNELFVNKISNQITGFGYQV